MVRTVSGWSRSDNAQLHTYLELLEHCQRFFDRVRAVVVPLPGERKGVVETGHDHAIRDVDPTVAAWLAQRITRHSLIRHRRIPARTQRMHQQARFAPG
jgi:hypothetical protein